MFIVRTYAITGFSLKFENAAQLTSAAAFLESFWLSLAIIFFVEHESLETTNDVVADQSMALGLAATPGPVL